MKRISLFAFIVSVIVAILILFNGCKKDNDSQPPTDNGKDSLQLWSNVHVIDTTVMVIDTSVSNFNAGVYVFQIMGAVPDFQTGDIIVGNEGEGYIRRVISVTLTGGMATFQTTQGTMEEVFKKGSLDFKIDMNDMEPGKTSAFMHSVSNRTLYNNGPLDVLLQSANLNIDPNWLFDFTFDSTGIDYFEMSTSGSSYSADAELKVTATQAVSLLNRRDTLISYNKIITKWVFAGPIPVPVVVKLNLSWLAEYSLDVAASVSTTTNTTTSGNLTLGVKYENQQWQGMNAFNPTTTVSADNLNGNATLTIKCALRPVISAKLYGVAGPNASVALMTEARGKVASPSLDWDLKAEAWGQTTVSADVTILGRTLASFPQQEWNTNRLTYRIPDQIQIVSGNNQTGPAGQSLPQPCKVRVLDSNGNPAANVPVYFAVILGGGSVTPPTIVTDANGYAQAVWTLGPQQGTNYINAAAKYGNLSYILGTPLEFTASANNISTFSTFTDPRDGQIYNTVQIGNQLWFAENLNYNTGVNWCYDNNSANCVVNGRLYDWNTALTACPTGWHLPSDVEWQNLINYLGGASLAGGKMKSIVGWDSPNTNATNSSGFTGLPSGGCSNNGLSFNNIGSSGMWWSSTEFTTTTAYNRKLNSGTGFADRYSPSKTHGFSCRCLKD